MSVDKYKHVEWFHMESLQQKIMPVIVISFAIKNELMRKHFLNERRMNYQSTHILNLSILRHKNGASISVACSDYD
jgi:hypothetical protein